MKLLPLLCLLSLWIGPASAKEIRVVTVEEGADAVLPCSSDSAVEEFDWKKENGTRREEVFLYTEGSSDKKDRVTIFKNELINGNASIKIYSTILKDNGTYICILGPFEKFPRQEFYISLNVGAAPKPYVKRIDENQNWRLLQCEAHGVPKPEVEWRDSSGNVLPLVLPPKEINATESDRRFYVTSELKVYKTDNYTCVVTQKDILHQINDTIIEKFPAPTIFNGTTVGVGVGVHVCVGVGVGGVVVGVFVGVVLACLWFQQRKSKGNGSSSMNDMAKATGEE